METLGFYLADREELNMISGVDNQEVNHRIEITGVWEYSMAVLESALCVSQQLIQHIRGTDKIRTIYIDTLGVGSLDFNITVEKKNSLVESGWKAAVEFVNGLLPDSEEKTQLMNSENLTCPIKIPIEVRVKEAESHCIIS